MKFKQLIVHPMDGRLFALSEDGRVFAWKRDDPIHTEGWLELSGEVKEKTPVQRVTCGLCGQSLDDCECTKS
jgi:hypothetical protein